MVRELPSASSIGSGGQRQLLAGRTPVGNEF
jgi:hypothetical protein